MVEELVNKNLDCGALTKGFQMVRYYGWYGNRARGERAKREAEAGVRALHPGGSNPPVFASSRYPNSNWPKYAA